MWAAARKIPRHPMELPHAGKNDAPAWVRRDVRNAASRSGVQRPDPCPPAVDRAIQTAIGRIAVEITDGSDERNARVRRRNEYPRDREGPVETAMDERFSAVGRNPDTVAVRRVV